MCVTATEPPTTTVPPTVPPTGTTTLLSLVLITMCRSETSFCRNLWTTFLFLLMPPNEHSHEDIITSFHAMSIVRIVSPGPQ